MQREMADGANLSGMDANQELEDTNCDRAHANQELEDANGE